jgi:hypothetical protein
MHTCLGWTDIAEASQFGERPNPLHDHSARLDATPSSRGVLFDQPHLGAESMIHDRMKTVGGDFFESVPAGDRLCNKKALRRSRSNHLLQIESRSGEQITEFLLSSFAASDNYQHLQIGLLAEIERRSLWNEKLGHDQARRWLHRPAQGCKDRFRLRFSPIMQNPAQEVDIWNAATTSFVASQQLQS